MGRDTHPPDLEAYQSIKQIDRNLTAILNIDTTLCCCDVDD
jgi:hypothetical protein